LDAGGMTVEQSHAEQVFEARHGLGNGGLTQVQHGGGLAKAAVLEHGDEYTQLAHRQAARQAMNQLVRLHASCSPRVARHGTAPKSSAQ
jgi:hypothetical protein